MKKDCCSEDVHIVSPLSIRQTVRLGREVLAEIEPAALEKPTRLNLGRWFTALERYRIFTYPVDDASFQGVSEGMTVPAPRGQIHILLPTSEYDAILANEDNGWARRARASFLHELGHAIKHVPEMLDGLARGQLGFHRVSSNLVPPRVNAEVQAFTIASCIGIPLVTLNMLPSRDVRLISDTYGFSAGFVKNYLKRLHLADAARARALERLSRGTVRGRKGGPG
jgi:hypothetical protein